ncbi:MAG: hypothetical protein LUF30_10705 [Lachnospiraceae bacterium]|nr:hypothetical protein [Lachnospiraceae bacterium]
MNVLAYALVPALCTLAFQTFASNFIIMEEAMIIYVITGCGIVWTAFMLIAGLCVIHEYGFGKTLIALILTAVAAVIIIFLGVLFFTLIEQMVDFIVSVGKEFLRRF